MTAKTIVFEWQSMEKESFCVQMVHGICQQGQTGRANMPNHALLVQIETLANSIDHYRLQMALSCYTSVVFDNALSVYEFLSVVISGLQERLKNGGVLERRRGITGFV